MLKKIDLFNNLTQDDLSNDLKMIADLCGMEIVIQLMRNYAGLQFYIPKISSFKSVYIRIIQSEGLNASNKDLASKLDVSEEFIRKIKIEIKKEKYNGKI